MPAAPHAAPTEPTGEPIALAEFARLADLSERQAQRLVAQEVVTSAGRGKVLYPLCLWQYIRYLRRDQERHDNGIGASKAPDPEMARLKLIREKIAVRRAALELRKEEEKFMQVADAVTAVSAVTQALRSNLQTVPKRYGTDGDDRRRLKLMIAELSRELADAASRALEALDPDAAEEERAAREVVGAD